MKLDSTWNVFKKAVFNNDKPNLLALSEDSIYCQICDTTETFEYSRWIFPVNDFIDLMHQKVFSERIRKVIYSKKYSILASEFSEWKPDYWSVDLTGNFILYEIIYVTYEKDEWAVGHEGQNYLFQFCKVKDQFKFIGVQTIP